MTDGVVTVALPPLEGVVFRIGIMESQLLVETVGEKLPWTIAACDIAWDITWATPGRTKFGVKLGIDCVKLDTFKEGVGFTVDDTDSGVDCVKNVFAVRAE